MDNKIKIAEERIASPDDASFVLLDLVIEVSEESVDDFKERFNLLILLVLHHVLENEVRLLNDLVLLEFFM